METSSQCQPQVLQSQGDFQWSHSLHKDLSSRSSRPTSNVHRFSSTRFPTSTPANSYGQYDQACLTPPDIDLGLCYDPAIFSTGLAYSSSINDLPSLPPNSFPLQDDRFFEADDISIEEDFPANFFLNPFAADLPGDLNLSSNPDTPLSFPLLPELPMNAADLSFSTIPAPEPPLFTTPPSSTPASNSPAEVEDKNTIHFIDHADKKSALRIRNTRISRAHRENKVKRIQELEKKLAASEAEMEMWKARALKSGWRK